MWSGRRPNADGRLPAAIRHLCLWAWLLLAGGSHTAVSAMMPENTPQMPAVNFLFEIPSGKQPQDLFAGPFGVHVTDDRIYVADDLSHFVFVFDRSGELVTRIGGRGEAPGQFAFIDKLITLPGGRLLAADTGNGRLQLLDGSGKHLKSVKRTGGLFARLKNPRNLAVDSRGRIFVADWGLDRVVVFDAQLDPIGTIGRKGQGPGQLHGPIACVLDGDDVLYVADFKNHRIQIFDPQGTYLRRFGSRGTGDAQFQHPTGLAFDAANRLFVADRNNHRIQILTAQGSFVGAFGGQGRGAGRFVKPEDIDIDAADRLYVVDKGNRRVQVFQISD